MKYRVRRVCDPYPCSMPPDPLAGIHRLTDLEPIAKTMLASLANLDIIG